MSTARATDTTTGTLVANTLIGTPHGKEWGPEWERFLDQWWLMESGETGYGQRSYRVAYDGTDAANTLSSADTTNGIGAHLKSQNATYQVEVRNSGINITGAPTFSAMTQGSVLFAGASGLLSQDNANLFWDDTNNRLGIATATPTEKLHVVGNARVSTFLGVGGAADTTHPLLVTGLAKITSRTGIGGDPDATAMLKITGGLIGTGNATFGTTSGDTITLAGTLVANEAATFNGNVVLGNAVGDSITVNGSPTFNELVTMVKNLVVDTTTFAVDALNDKVGVGALPASTDAMFQVAGYMRVTSNTAGPTAGEGMELGYNATTNYGIINSVDRASGTTYGGLIIRSSDLQLTDGTNIRFNTNGTGISFYGGTPVAKPTVTGAKGGNAALGSLMTALASLGLVTDSTTA